MAIIGIDLGTTNSLAAYYRDGKSILIPNEFGEYLTPSVVHVNEQDEVIVGRVAKEALITDPDNTAAVFKRSMGLDRKYCLRGRYYLPEELSAFVIKKLVEDAKRALQEEIEEVIISVPAYFDDMRRKATKRAGEIAGVKVERLINEPSAAALACRMVNREEESIYLVFDFGGGTLDVSIVECFDNIISVIAVSGDNHLGGSDFDHMITDYICQQLGADKKDLTGEGRAVLLRKAEQLKMMLSESETAEIEIQADWLQGKVSLNRQHLIDLSEELFRRIHIPLVQSINDCGHPLQDIDRIVMVGGSSKMEVVRAYLRQMLQKDLFTEIQPDEMVALGVGYYSGMKARNEDIKEMVMTDICPFSLGVDVRNIGDRSRPYFSPIIERNSVLPCSKTERYQCEPMQTEACVRIYQGDEMYAEDNRLLEEMCIPLQAGTGNQVIVVRFTYDINGILDVDVVTEADNRSFHKTVVKKELDMTPEAIRNQLKQMEAIKQDPRDKEENQYVFQLGKALYHQTRGSNREQIMFQISIFEHALKTGDALQIRQERERALQLFCQMSGGMFRLDKVMELIMQQIGEQDGEGGESASIEETDSEE